MKRLYLLLILLVVAFKLSFSTPQVRDVLYWNGMTYYIYPFIEVEKRFSNAQLNRLKKEVKDQIVSSNWRGYYYEFEIHGDSLFLISIKDNHEKDITSYVFGSNDRIMLDDFSDTLYLGYGKSYYDEEFPTMIYESEMSVVFKNGIISWCENHKNKSKQSVFSPYSMNFVEYIYSSIRWNDLDQTILEKKPQVYLEYSTDSLGRIGDVIILRSSGYSEFDKEAIRVIAALPEFSTHFVCGKYLIHKYKLRVVFDKNKIPKYMKNSCQE